MQRRKKKKTACPEGCLMQHLTENPNSLNATFYREKPQHASKQGAYGKETVMLPVQI